MTARESIALIEAALKEFKQTPYGHVGTSAAWERLASACHPAAIRSVLARVRELEAALNGLIEAADSMRGTYGVKFGETPEDADVHMHDRWAEEFLAERTDAARAALKGEA